MNIFNLFKKILKEEKSIPAGKKTLILIDLDDCALKASSNMKVYRKLPTDKVEVALTPDQYAHEKVTPENKKYYDYRDFRDPKKVYESIVNGAPYINNLKVIDDFYNAGADLGILTARGCEDAVARAVKIFLKVRDKNGNLVKANIPRERIHAVNDDDKVYPGNTDSEKKSLVMKKYASMYDYLYLIDDDKKNRNFAIALKKTLDNPKAIRTIDAAKHRGEPGKIEESVITEMATKDVGDDILTPIKNGDYETAIKKYLMIIKDQPKYAGKSGIDVLHSFISYGKKTFKTMERDGKIPEGSAQKLVDYAAANDRRIVSELGLSTQEAPKLHKAEKLELKKQEEIKKAEEKEKTYKNYEGSDDLTKISDRIEKYNELKKRINTYLSAWNKEYAPFAVNIKAYGNGGVKAGVKKPNLTDDNPDTAFKSKSERYAAPMLAARKKLIPEFVQTKAKANFDRDTLANLKKAEELGKEYVTATENLAYLDFMYDYINNIVAGFRDFKRSGGNLEDLKSGIDFPYDDFVKLEKWLKNNKLEADEKKAIKPESSATRPELSQTIYKARADYTNLANGIAKSMREGSTADFLLNTKNYAIAKAMLELPNNLVTGEMKNFLDYKSEKIKMTPELIPQIKDLYFSRGKNYSPISSEECSKLNSQLTVLKSDYDKGVDVDDKIISVAKKIMNIAIDKIIAIDIVSISANDKMLAQFTKLANKHELLKAKYDKEVKTNSKFDPKSNKYKQYYDPEGDGKNKEEETKELYKEIISTVKANFPELVDRKLQKILVNLTAKKYSYEELKQIKAALDNGVKNMFDLLSQPEFKNK